MVEDVWADIMRVIMFLNIDPKEPHSIASEIPMSQLGLDLIKYALSAALFLGMKPQVRRGSFSASFL